MDIFFVFGIVYVVAIGAGAIFYVIAIRFLILELFKRKPVRHKITVAAVLTVMIVTPPAAYFTIRYRTQNSDRYAYQAALKINFPFTVFYQQRIGDYKLDIASMQDDFFRADYVYSKNPINGLVITEKQVAEIKAGTENHCAHVSDFGSPVVDQPCELVSGTSLTNLYVDRTEYLYDYKGTRIQLSQIELSNTVHSDPAFVRDVQLDKAAANLIQELIAERPMAR